MAIKEIKFVKHIEKHLKEMGIGGKVVCKICGKDIDTISEEENINELELDNLKTLNKSLKQNFNIHK